MATGRFSYLLCRTKEGGMAVLSDRACLNTGTGDGVLDRRTKKQKVN